VGLLLGSLGVGIVLAQGPPPSVSPPSNVGTPHEETGSNTTVQMPSYAGTITVGQVQYEGMSEADEATALQGKAIITASGAEKAALAANPGSSATKTELDNENGVLVYSVELSNGKDVKVDAGNGQVLHTEQAGADEEVGNKDGDNVKEEVQQERDSQTDDAHETPHAEGTSG
jgi:hypothetical protein